MDFVSHRAGKNYGFSKGSSEPSAVWLTAFDYLVGQQIQLYACDSEGSLYIFRTGEGKSKSFNKDDKDTYDVSDWRDSKDVLFQFSSSQVGIHQNGIIQVLLVQQENLFFTIGYD